MELAKRYWLRTLAASMVPDRPLALSLAPGLTKVEFITSETRLSISPDMMT